MAAFASEWVAAFTSEWVAGFVGIRRITAPALHTSAGRQAPRPSHAEKGAGIYSGPSTAAPWCASPSATNSRPASRCAPSLSTQTRTWAIYTLLKTGLEGPQSEEDGDKRPRTRFLPDNIYDAIRLFKGSRFMQEVMGEEVHAEIKLWSQF